MEAEQMLGARSTMYCKLIHEKWIEWEPESIYIVQGCLEERGFQRRFPLGYKLASINVPRASQIKIQIPFLFIFHELLVEHMLYGGHLLHEEVTAGNNIAKTLFLWCLHSIEKCFKKGINN